MSCIDLFMRSGIDFFGEKCFSSTPHMTSVTFFRKAGGTISFIGASIEDACLYWKSLRRFAEAMNSLLRSCLFSIASSTCGPFISSINGLPVNFESIAPAPPATEKRSIIMSASTAYLLNLLYLSRWSIGLDPANRIL